MFRKSYESVPAKQWQEWTEENDAVILDVREPAEWQLGTLPGATTVSMRDLPSRIQDLDPDQAVLCVCRSGNRSRQVAAYLAHSGFEKVANLSGGVKALGMQN